jgi:hypothetical protein
MQQQLDNSNTTIKEIKEIIKNHPDWRNEYQICHQRNIEIIKFLVQQGYRVSYEYIIRMLCKDELEIVALLINLDQIKRETFKKEDLILLLGNENMEKLCLEKSILLEEDCNGLTDFNFVD